MPERKRHNVIFNFNEKGEVYEHRKYQKREYTEQHYLPAAKTYLKRAAKKGLKGKQLINQLQILQENRDSMYFGEIKITTSEKKHAFVVQVYFNDVNPDTVRVELFAEGMNGEAPQITNMERGKKSEGTANGYHFVASVNSTRPATDYTPRAIPNLPGVSVPLESPLILWQH